MALSVLRRYTPPTCTLEIMAKDSPLSRWAGQPVLKNLRFSLRLDDPKLAQDNWVSLQGDRSQLEALCDAVQSYVQNFLEQGKGTRGGATLLQARETPLPAAPTSMLPASQSTVGAIAPMNARADAGVIADAGANPASGSGDEVTAPRATQGIHLRPKGRLSHELILGSLGTEESGPVLGLTTLQLFDLANALDEYNTDVVALPNLEKPNLVKLTTAHWPKAAAAAVLAVAMSASMAKIWDTASKNGVPTSGDQRISTQLPPIPGSTSGAQPQVSNQPLPPPPPTGSLQPGQTAVPGQPGAPVVVGQTPNSGVATNPGALTPGGAAAPAGPAPGGNGGSIEIAQVPGQPTQPGGQANAGNLQLEQRNATAADAIKDAPNPNAAQSQKTAKIDRAAAPTTADSAAATARTPAAVPPAAAIAKTAESLQAVAQIDEARSFLSSRWQPPEGLTETAEFIVTVDAYGKVSAINPLNQAAKNTLDRTGIPNMGDELVSPLKGASSLGMRLVFKPKGGVDVFQESLQP